MIVNEQSQAARIVELEQRQNEHYLLLFRLRECLQEMTKSFRNHLAYPDDHRDIQAAERLLAKFWVRNPDDKPKDVL